MQGEPIRLRRGNKTYWTLGKDSSTCDIFALHTSVSRQHAVIQFRHSARTQEVEPFLFDLESVNGTTLTAAGGEADHLDAARYYRLMHMDKFSLGFSTREYVLICEERASLPS
jgi:smad nuclear-interacting protein 1